MKDSIQLDAVLWRGKKTDALTYNYNLWIDGLTRSITDLAYENDCYDYLTRDSHSK